MRKTHPLITMQCLRLFRAGQALKYSPSAVGRHCPEAGEHATIEGRSDGHAMVSTVLEGRKEQRVLIQIRLASHSSSGFLFDPNSAGTRLCPYWQVFRCAAIPRSFLIRVFVTFHLGAPVYVARASESFRQDEDTTLHGYGCFRRRGRLLDR